MPTGTLHFTLDIDGERQLNAKLHGYLGRLEDLSPAFEAISEDWTDSREEVFAGEGAYDGLEGWPELSKRYAAWKRRKYPGKPILQRTGALRAAESVGIDRLHSESRPPSSGGAGEIYPTISGIPPAEAGA